jgi:hypothetical protein
MTDVDPALKKQILDVPKAQRVPNLHQYHQADDLG